MKIVLNQSLILASPPSVIYQPSSFSALAVDLASTVVVNMPRTMEEEFFCRHDRSLERDAKLLEALQKEKLMIGDINDRSKLTLPKEMRLQMVEE
ncbi:hypothetical protein JHK87_050385 [Glycine soja]|nr:hypothetical protein JHK87_050385 [Glycine soja]